MPGKDFRDDHILGACNPPLAHQALQAKDQIDTMLPGNIILQATEDGNGCEVAAADPAASMQAVDTTELARIAETERDKLKHVIDAL